MFVRKKTTKYGTVKHYLVKNCRDGGKIRQKVLYYLGQDATVDAKLASLDATASYYRNLLKGEIPCDPLVLLHGRGVFAEMIVSSEAEADRLREIVRSAQAPPAGVSDNKDAKTPKCNG